MFTLRELHNARRISEELNVQRLRKSTNQPSVSSRSISIGIESFWSMVCVRVYSDGERGEAI